MMSHTDDEAKGKAYADFVEQIESKCTPRLDELDRRYIASPSRAGLPRERYQVYDRHKIALAGLYNEASIPLQTEETTLIQQYDTICGEMTVHYDGREQTIDQMYGYQLELDRAVREETWKLVAERRRQEDATLNAIFDDLVRLRTRCAHNAGCDTFCDYQFAKYNRFDYTAEDCFALHEAVESLVVPVLTRLRDRDREQRRRWLGVEAIQPWDMTVDSQNRPPLHPFKDNDELTRKCETVFSRIDPILGSQFAELLRAGWIDIDSRKGKAHRGFIQPFGETRCSFIFLHCSGVYDNVDMLLHEGAHALHDIACRDDPLLYYRNDYPLEIAEVVASSFEFLARDHLDVFYDDQERKRVRRDHLEGVVNMLVSACMVDAFQHWVYATDDHDHEDRAQHWLSLQERFGWRDPKRYLHDALANRAHGASWQEIGHLFRMPFYFIEYAIAQVGALQLWRNSRSDCKQAVRQLRSAMALGGSKPLPGLWAAAGLTFDFSADTLRPLIKDVARELEVC